MEGATWGLVGAVGQLFPPEVNRDVDGVAALELDFTTQVDPDGGIGATCSVGPTEQIS
jgi:hypothetical protein